MDATVTLTALVDARPDTPAAQDAYLACEASRAVARLTGQGAVKVEAVTDDGSRQAFVLPAKAVRLLTDILTFLGQEREVAIVPLDTELTTQQAADMLNVSRPYVIRLLDDGKLAHRMVGTHRRIRLDHLIAYRTERDARSEAARQRLVDQAQELDMGY